MAKVKYPRQPRGVKPGTIRGNYKKQGLRPRTVLRQKAIAEDIALGLSKMALVDKYTALWVCTPDLVYWYIRRVYANWSKIKDEDLSYVAESKQLVIASLQQDLENARITKNHKKALELLEHLKKANAL